MQGRNVQHANDSSRHLQSSSRCGEVVEPLSAQTVTLANARREESNVRRKPTNIQGEWSMRTLNSALCASILVLATLALAPDGVIAAPAAQGDKSPTSFKIGTAAGTTESDCTKQGGKVATATDGGKWCIIGGTSGRFMCLVYKPGHEGDGRYCSQGVNVPN